MTTYEQPKDWIERHLVEDPGGLLACEPSRLDTLNEELRLARQANEAQHQQLAAALAAIKVKNEAIMEARNWNWLDDDAGNIPVAESIQEALAIQPDDSALKVWLGEPVGIIEFGGFWLNENNEVKVQDGTPLYAPKGMK